MLPSVRKIDRTAKSRSVYTSIIYSLCMIDDVAQMQADHHEFRRSLGHDFTVPQIPCADHGEDGTLVNVFRTWLTAHEEAQVMIASVLVVVGLWWLMRTVLTLLINLICPLLVVLIAVVCVPQLRGPLLGQNYPMLANLLRNILTKLAENLKTQ